MFTNQKAKASKTSNAKQSINKSQTQKHPSQIVQRVTIDPSTLTSQDVLLLQRTIGNRAVGKLLNQIAVPKVAQNQSTLQRVLKAGVSAADEARLVRQYHNDEDSGDACSIGSRDADVHRTAIRHYRNAQQKRRRASNMHVAPDRGHLQAIATLDNKIARRNTLIRDIEPAPEPRRVAREEIRRPDPTVTLGTAAQASFLPGNQSAWPH